MSIIAKTSPAPVAPPTEADSQRCGAMPDEWARLQALGLTADLLPVVSNPKAQISEHSKMRDLGKTPSRYDRDHKVVGLPKWTHNIATENDIARWSKEPDYGACVQTRVVRAIDVDIADLAAATEVRELVELGVGRLPLRRRAGTGKCLLIFSMAGEFTKRVIRTPHGLIEFLATGQQFVACGMHPSGSRYQWVDQVTGEIGLPSSVPERTPEEFELLWAELINASALPDGVSTSKASVAPKKGRLAADINDPTVAWLEANGHVTGYERDGRVDVRCPFEHEHTSDTGPSSTSYFPRGVGGFEQGHFRCLHAHCAGRTDGDFLEALGLVADEFEVLPALADAKGNEVLPLPPFARQRGGMVEPTLPNLELALLRPDVCGVHIRRDTFRDETMIAPAGTEEWRAVDDEERVELRLQLQKDQRLRFRPIDKGIFRDILDAIAKRSRFDSAQHWLKRQVWDGVPRVDSFLSAYLDTEDTPYTRAVGRYIFSALAGRVLEPGVKADMVPVLVGPQGAGKSSAVAAISPAPDFFYELDIGLDGDDIARSMRGKLVIELGELTGLRKREDDWLKAFVSRRFEIWVPKYKEDTARYDRRSLFIGTTNQREFLRDDTGHRRWLPVDVPAGDAGARVRAVERDRDQLWAEGAVLFAQGGVQWLEAERLAVAEHSRYEMTEPWVEAIRYWLARDEMDQVEGTPRGDRPFTTETVLTCAVNIELKNIRDAERKRVAAVLRRLGFAERREMRGGVRATWWSK
jgi:hypothetical protein